MLVQSTGLASGQLLEQTPAMNALFEEYRTLAQTTNLVFCVADLDVCIDGLRS